MKNFERILWGIVFIAFGLILGLKSLDIIKVNIFFDGWWTLFIIIPCFIGLFDFNKEGKTGNLLGILIGLLLLLAAQDVIDFDIIWKLAMPMVIIVVGLLMIFKGNDKYNIKEKYSKSKSKENISATFAEQIINKDGEKIDSLNLNSTFGSIVLDLKKAIINEECVIRVNAIFGGVEIHVPEDVLVKVNATPIFGGVDNKHKDGCKEKIIYVDAFCLFGGIEIK